MINDGNTAMEFCWIAIVAAQIALERDHHPGDDLFMSKVQAIECELRKLSPEEMRQVRDWLDDFLEDQLKFGPEFEAKIRESECDMASHRHTRTRQPADQP
jgi:hypothetical protein